MVDVESATAEIMPGKRKKNNKEEERRRRKYNGLLYSIGRRP